VRKRDGASVSNEKVQGQSRESAWGLIVQIGLSQRIYEEVGRRDDLISVKSTGAVDRTMELGFWLPKLDYVVTPKDYIPYRATHQTEDMYTKCKMVMRIGRRTSAIQIMSKLRAQLEIVDSERFFQHSIHPGIH
jgi:hypothetical protein